MEPVAKPAGGPFGEYVRENRLDIAKNMGEDSKGKGAVLRKAGELWKEMSEEDKAPYVKRFEEHTAAYKAYAASDSFVPKEKKENKKKRDFNQFLALRGLDPQSVSAKRKATEEGGDAEAVKKPAGGAFGVWVAEKRSDIAKEAEDSDVKGQGANLKTAANIWKDMPEEDKAPYIKKFEEQMAAYQAYAASSSFVPKQPSINKLKKEFLAFQKYKETGVKEEKPSKKQKTATAPGEAPVIDAAILDEAKKEGLKLKLTTLMEKPEIAAKGAQRVLEALRAEGGKVPAAKKALLLVAD